MISIRGATTVESNCTEEIKEKSIELFNKIITVNELAIDKIHTIIFSCTDDITKAYPGGFVREYYNLNNVSIMHFNEMKVENSLNFCIRILVLSNDEKISTKFVYLHNAKTLRRDLLSEQF